MRKLLNDDRGIAAILVTVIVLLILLVTTLGIATIARREQRQSLDRQLSAEAYYAAESGVNDVIQKLKSLPSSSSTDCTTRLPNYWNSSGSSLILPNSIVTALGGIGAQSQYTCVLTDSQPQSLEYSQVSSDSGVTANFKVTGGLKTLVVGWEDYLGSNSTRPACGGSMQFTDAGSWGSATPVLKLDVTDLEEGAVKHFDRNDMINHTNSFYLYPCARSGPGFGVAAFTPNSPTTNNSIVSGECDTTATPNPTPPKQVRRCNVNITFGGAPTNLLIRIKPIYSIAKITVVGLDSSDKPQPLQGGQKIIDVTAKATDVVRRIQVRYSQSSQYIFALDSANSLCKRLKVTPTTGDADPTGLTSAADKAICSPASP